MTTACWGMIPNSISIDAMVRRASPLLLVLLGGATLVACTDDQGVASIAPAIDGGAPDSASTDDVLTPKPDAGTGDAPPTNVRFKRHTVDPNLEGPAYASVADLTNDGKPDLVISSFGKATTSIPPGQILIYKQGADLDTWTATNIVSTSDGIKFPNQTSLLDIDGDGDLDLLAPAGFFPCNISFIPGNTPCGAVLWYEQTPSGWAKHALLEGDVRFFHLGVLLDIDSDGTRDLVTVAEEQVAAGVGRNTAETIWFKGDKSADRFQKTSGSLGVGLGGFPRLRDIDNDGDIDLAAAEFSIAGESFAWKENRGASWDHHVFNADSGAAIQMAFVDNLYGDGELHAVGANHTNTAKAMPDPQESAVFVFDIPSDPRQPWMKHPISEGIVSVPGTAMSVQLAPGIFGTGDVDGDGDIDIVVSGDGDPNVYWLEQTGRGTWKTHILETELEQAGGMIIVDLDGDGRNEIVVTGYTDNVVYVYERER